MARVNIKPAFNAYLVPKYVNAKINSKVKSMKIHGFMESARAASTTIIAKDL